MSDENPQEAANEINRLTAALAKAEERSATLQRLLDDAGNERQVWFDRCEKAEATLLLLSRKIVP